MMVISNNVVIICVISICFIQKFTTVYGASLNGNDYLENAIENDTWSIIKQLKDTRHLSETHEKKLKLLKLLKILDEIDEHNKVHDEPDNHEQEKRSLVQKRNHIKTVEEFEEGLFLFFRFLKLVKNTSNVANKKHYSNKLMVLKKDLIAFLNANPDIYKKSFNKSLEKWYRKNDEQFDKNDDDAVDLQLFKWG